MSDGVAQRSIHEVPVAVLDFETTGLTPGIDRVVEVSVVRVDPGQEPRLVFDTLVHPRRPVAATDIHGITDADVQDAPFFEDIAGALLASLQGCVVASYNIYFDIKFLRYELDLAGVTHVPPHLCLMYLRPLLGLGYRCRLEDACRKHGIDYRATHRAADDAQAASRLFLCYRRELRKRRIEMFGDLARFGSYKFLSSFRNAPFASPESYGLRLKTRIRSRAGLSQPREVDPSRAALREYRDAIKTMVADLTVTREEQQHAIALRRKLGLKPEQIRMVHAQVFAQASLQLSRDGRLGRREARVLHRLHACLAELGWAPGT